jgi:hypothetical protein
MPRKPISISDLETQLDPNQRITEAEVNRLSAIIKSIALAISQNEYVSEHEKNIFCSAVGNTIEIGKTISDFSICNNYKLKILYPTYAHHLYEGVQFFKINSDALRTAIMARAFDFKNLDIKKYVSPVTKEEVTKDLSYLYAQADLWEQTILITNHSDELLQIASKETRKQLKDLEAEIPIHEKGTHQSKIRKRGVLLLQRYIYQMCLEVKEAMGVSSYSMRLNTVDIEFTLHSLYHIVSRHYAGGVRQFNTGKSFVTGHFVPRELHMDLGRLISDIDFSGVYAKDSIEKIAIDFKGRTYRIWIQDAIKQIPGKGNVTYKRVETFYPVTDIKELTDLSNNYVATKVNNDLKVYCKK